MSKPKLLIIEREKHVFEQINSCVKKDYNIKVVHDANDAIEKFNKYCPDIITLDLKLSEQNDHENCFGVLEEIISADPYAKVIITTCNKNNGGNNGENNIIECLQRGAYDYFVKPINPNELRIVLKRALYIRKLEIENRKFQSEFVERDETFGILGNCDEIKRVIKVIKSLAQSDIPVLIHGESGTGKELVARAIHKCSKKSKEAFIPIDSGAIPDTLLESELFGHEKGAFTDAKSRKIGKVELANRGTLFFDEIAELSLSLQVKLLRFLQEKQIQRVGGNAFIPVDVRIIAATNKDLEQEVERQNFRKDIFYRLNGITIELPPLRERDDDVIFLANYLIKQISKANGRKPKKLSYNAAKALRAYEWPGNIRELQNKIKRALVLSTERNIRVEDLGLSNNGNIFSTQLTLKEAKNRVEKEILQKSLNKYGGNLSEISKCLGIARSTIYKLMDKYTLNQQ